MSKKEYKEKREDQTIEEYLEEIMPDTNVYKGYGGKKRRGYCCVPFHKIVWDLYHPEDKWEKGYDIHHLNENPLDNDSCNLIKLTKSEHMRYHNLCKKKSESTRKKMSIAKSGTNHPAYGKRAYNARFVMVEYQIFSTQRRAAKAFSINTSTIRKRINNKISGYFYI